MRPTWLFDLDNTLHDASHAIFPSINRQMADYIERHLNLDADSAQALRQRYWQHYGATLLGLMRHHGTSPDEFLRETHCLANIDRMVVYQRALRAMLRKLPGRRIIFTNGPRNYALQVLSAMRMDNAFDDVFSIERMRYEPKPGLKAFRHLLADHRLRARDCILVEDSAQNLRPAKQLGMRTVWISQSLRTPPHVDLRLPNVLMLARATRHVVTDRGLNYRAERLA